MTTQLTISGFPILAWLHSHREQTEAVLKGKKFKLDTINGAYPYIEKDLPLSDDAPGGHVPFRRELSRSSLLRLWPMVRTFGNVSEHLCATRESTESAKEYASCATYIDLLGLLV